MTPPLCACGCQKEVKFRDGKWNRYATRKCFLGTFSKRQRQDHMRAWMARNPRALEILAENGSRGGRAMFPERWIELLEKWQDLTPREALQAAWYSGYKSGYKAKRREEAETAAVDAQKTQHPS